MKRVSLAKEPLVRKATKEQIKRMRESGNDTIVQCSYCERTQYLLFRNGLKNGWDRCCHGFTMPIIYQEANIAEAVKSLRVDRLLEVKKQ